MFSCGTIVASSGGLVILLLLDFFLIRRSSIQLFISYNLHRTVCQCQWICQLEMHYFLERYKKDSYDLFAFPSVDDIGKEPYARQVVKSQEIDYLESLGT